MVWRWSYYRTWLKPETRKKIQNLKLSKTISECCELMTSKKLCMWWTNYNDNNYLFSCFYSNNYSTAAVYFVEFQFACKLLFFLNTKRITNIEVRFPIFYAASFTEVNCKSKRWQISRIRKYILILITIANLNSNS